MEALLYLKMDRPINKDLHYISPGSYEFELKNGERYTLDFCESYGSVSQIDSSEIKFELREADYTAFPEISQLQEKLCEIVRILDFYIYTGEDPESEIKPVKILSFSITDSGRCQKKRPRSTPFIAVTFTSNKDPEHPFWRCTYTFKEPLLSAYSFEDQ